MVEFIVKNIFCAYFAYTIVTMPYNDPQDPFKLFGDREPPNITILKLWSIVLMYYLVFVVF